MKYRPSYKKLIERFFPVYLIALMCLLLGFSVVEIYSKRVLLQQTFNLLHNTIMSYDLRTVVYSLSPTVESHFLNIKVMDPHGKILVNVDGPKRDALQVWLSIPVSTKVSSNSNFSIEATFNLTRSVVLAFCLWALFLILSLPFARRIQQKLEERLRQEAKFNEMLEVQAVAERTAHDIRSPLTLLKALVTSGGIAEDKQQLIMMASNRIGQISDDLLEHRKKQAGFFFGLATLLEKLIVQKRIQFPDVAFHLSTNIADDLKIQMSAEFLTRVLSNLITNSVEAMSYRGNVNLRIEKISKDRVQLVVEDNGPGISDDIIDRIGEKGFTFGKENGNGLGLYYARKEIEKYNGSLQIKSVFGKGTQVILEVPYC